MRILPLVTSLVLFCLLGTPVLQAQEQETPVSDTSDEDVQVRVLEIHDGNVKLDGWVLPPSNLPSGLYLGGIDMTYHFSGPVTPVLEIDGEVYVLDGDHLMRMDDIARNASFSDRPNVYFLGEPEMNVQVPPQTSGDAAMARSAMVADDLEEAGEQAYLHQLSSRDRTLYDQIQHEQSLELETYRLAGEYRRARDSDEQGNIEDALRNKLGDSFDLKQQIRTDEIEQAEVQIGELRRLLDERETRKEQIVERRLRELIGKRGN